MKSNCLLNEQKYLSELACLERTKLYLSSKVQVFVITSGNNPEITQSSIKLFENVFLRCIVALFKNEISLFLSSRSCRNVTQFIPVLLKQVYKDCNLSYVGQIRQYI